MISDFAVPVMLDVMLKNIEDEEPDWKGYAVAGGIFVALVMVSISEARFFFLANRAGFQLRSIVTAAVHRKILFVNPTDRAEFSTGKIVNFVSADAETLQMSSDLALGVLVFPIRLLVASVLLYLQLGTATFVALGLFCLTAPVQITLASWTIKYVRRSLSKTDKRAKLEEELVAGIETVKFNAWEKAILSRIVSVRDEELRLLWFSSIISTVNVLVVSAAIFVVSAVSFGVYVLMGNELTARKAFVSIVLFNLLRAPFFQLPAVIQSLMKSYVCVKRVEPFLMAEEQSKSPSPPPPAAIGEVAVRVAGDFSWSLKAEPLLRGLDLELPAGSLTAVVGRTGSGKTSILSSVIGLMQRVSGPSPVVRGRLSFVPQAPFIVNATVRDNITFGRDFEEERYQSVIHAASLGPDIAMFPNGDATELGERGINISGGQKQRVALARALYSDADVCLLDDPLSALDSRVGQSVFRECIVGAMRDKTVVLVTNHLQYVERADQILFVKDGEITERGTYKELMKVPNGGFAQMMAETLAEQDTSKKRGLTAEAATSIARSEEIIATSQAPEQSGKDTRLIRDEHRVVGWVSGEVLMSYVRAMGGKGIVGVVVAEFVLVEIVRVVFTVWLSYWTFHSGDDDKHSEGFYSRVYAWLSVLLIVMTLFRQLTILRLGIIASRTLHRDLLNKLFRMPMRFFHTTTIGRVLNRLTKDLSGIDNLLVGLIAFFMIIVLECISSFLMIAVVTPLSLPFLVPLVTGLYFVYLYFQSSSRELKRMDSIARSPIFSSIHDAVNGVATIRAFNSEDRATKACMEQIDRSVIMSLLYHSVDHWFNIRAGFVGVLATLAAAILAVEQHYNASLVGLIISYALKTPSQAGFIVRCTSRAELIFNSVERVTEYADLPEEAPVEIPGSVPDGWPSTGRISFHCVKMRYRPGLPLVLKGLSATIEPGQRVGVVGRTGAGKSSLMNVLLRMVELDEGHISVDGLNIARIGLGQLRSQIAVIPQVPFLFTGSIRANLDPFQQHSDDVLWRALRRAHLDHVVREHGSGLEMELREGGTPLSFGQTQLLSLARAIVRDSKILVLDEATANVDMDTDSVIQNTIKTEFHDRTILIIAHRLHTIIDADKVMVLSNGMLVECDTPAELLKLKDGMFAKMVKDTGDACERFLRSIAFGEMTMGEARSKGMPDSFRKA